MNRELAKKLKAAGFPVGAYRLGHKFYPPEHGGAWTEAARRHGVMITPYDLEERMADIREGYYCPNLSDLIDACGPQFSRLWILKALWMAESVNAEHTAVGDSPEEAVGKLWLALHKPKSGNIPA
ncbi:MAG: hypothetical protein P4L80_11255 [Xanthobacteraceae bacterium]|nr:hypothetical protein [Xanthobacteraceae bacterium]